jgi:hypothetical protein
MLNRCMLVAILTAAALVLGTCGSVPAFAGEGRAAADKKESDKKEEKKSGTVVGEITAKGDNYVEVKADGEEKARRYVPHWVGGAPKDGGGPDKEMLKTIKELKVGSRVKLEWEFEERPRVVKVEVLKEPGKDKEKDKDKK